MVIMELEAKCRHHLIILSPQVSQTTDKLYQEIRDSYLYVASPFPLYRQARSSSKCAYSCKNVKVQFRPRAQKNSLYFMDIQEGLKLLPSRMKVCVENIHPWWGLGWPLCDWAPGTLRLGAGGASGVILVLMTIRRLGVTRQVLNSSPRSPGAGGRAPQRTCCRYLDDNPPIIN